MIFTKAKRVIKAGFISFWRNGFLSFSAIVMLSISLFIVGSIFFITEINRAFLEEIKNRVDINVYFTLDAPEPDILSLKKNIELLPQVSSVSYISREEAIEKFKARHEGNAILLQGLEEIGHNPLPASITIKAKDPAQYEGIATYLEKTNQGINGKSIIDEINYARNKLIIDRAGRIVPLLEKTGWAISIVFIIISILATFNTIRLIIFASRDEIGVMKLVGASNTFVRGPFIVSGIMCGIVSGLLALILLGFGSYYLDIIFVKFLSAYPEDIGSIQYLLFSYFKNNLGELSFVLLLGGVILASLSSYIAVKRYLKV